MLTPLKSIVDAWCRVIKDMKKRKQSRFGQYAEEAMKFLDGSHDWMFNEKEMVAAGGMLAGAKQAIKPMYKFTNNKVSEYMQTFSPYLVAREPRMRVTYRRPFEFTPPTLGNPMDPMFAQQYQMLLMQQQMLAATRESHAEMFEEISNWVQLIAGKKVEARAATDEALIKGEAPLWIEMAGDGETWFPKAFHDSVDNLIKDMDAKKLSDMGFCARECCHRVSEVEEEYGLAPGSLRKYANNESAESQAKRASSRNQQQREQGQAYDLLTYWKIYSKTGLGQKFVDYEEEHLKAYPDLKEWVDGCGKNCFLVVAEGCPFPLNLPTELLMQGGEAVFQATRWPIPFHDIPDPNEAWPYESVVWYWKPNDIWPISPIKPVVGLLRLANWIMSFLADKAAISAHTILGIGKAAHKSFHEQLEKNNAPFMVVDIEEALEKPLNQIIDFVKPPPFEQALWMIGQQALGMVDDQLGISEIKQTMAIRTQSRSAADAEIKDERATTRIDDMADKVEDTLSRVAKKEMLAARWLMEAGDVSGVLGPLGASVWESQILTSDVREILYDYTYRVEAGSVRKPNKRTRIQQLNEFGQLVMPIFGQLAAAGAPQPLNQYIADVGKELEIDTAAYQVPLPPAPEEPPLQGAA